jgi:toxin ParE1/3/4
MSFGYELISGTDRLREFPSIGRIVPEYRSDNIREIIFRPYRVVYRVNYQENLCEIARVWHSARGIPQLS